ncbi:SDR family NAD(P)-dependent oxidoreductase [Streptomyces sp. NPDC047002]|uniref:SDR family NAD(P)-dependent oxidoreductase n=1 Tax=Streptomyces sp. NPDC047002 TaxID=3155475 RepID=UPI003456D6C5
MAVDIQADRSAAQVPGLRPGRGPTGGLPSGGVRGLALVTGASSGIGAAVAERLAREGYRLLLAGRDSARLAAVAAPLGAATVTADLAHAEGVEAVARAARERGEPLTLVAHAAGRGWFGPVAAMDGAVAQELISVNLLAPIRLTSLLLDALHGSGGRVVFVSSVATLGVAHEAAYSASKAGLRTFADALRLESGIGVTTVFPSAVDTDFFRRRGRPYDRRFPRRVPAAKVADALVDGVSRGRAEVFVPRWPRLAALTHAGLPAVYRLLARRFG